MAQIFGSFQGPNGSVYQNHTGVNISTGDVWFDHANADIKIYNGSEWTEVAQGAGATGYTGSQGDQGIIGFTGSQGDQGVVGFTGSSGAEDATLQSVTTNGNTTTTTIFATTSGQHEGNVASRDGSANVLDIGSANDGSDATITADVTGDVVGDVTGSVTGDVLGNLTGNVTGEVNGNVNTRTGTTTVLDVGTLNDGTDALLTADVVGDVTSSGTSSFSGTIDAVGGQIMGNIDGDVRTRTGSHKIVDVGTNGDGTDSEINIHDINVAGTLSSDDITSTSISITGDMLVTGDTVMTGNLTVNGETTIINSNTITSGDALIVLNADLPSGQAPSLDSGLEINRGSSANVQILWVEGSDYFELRDINGVKQDLVIGNLTSTGIDDNATSTAITIDASENVGIGGAGNAKLEVFGPLASPALGTYNNSAAIISTIAGGYGMSFSVDGTGAGYIQAQNFTSATAYNLVLQSAGGNVSIGTTTVGQFGGVDVGLTVDGGGAYSGIAVTDGATTGSLTQGYSTTYLYNQANGNMLFGTNNTERLRIDSSGNVGIGTTSPAGKQHTALATSHAWGAAWSSGTAVFGGAGALNGAFGISYNDTDGAVLGAIAPGVAWKPVDIRGSELSFSIANIEKMRIDSSGNVGIGTDNPDALLHVDGAIQAKSSIETYQALTGTSVSIDCSAASVFSLSTTGTTTFSFTNVPSTSNTALGLTLEVTAGGTHTLTWPASVKWAGGSAPDAPASGETNIYGFYTRNAGTTWYGFLSGAAMA